MAKQVAGLLVLLALASGTAAAQDARAVIQAAAKNLGVDQLKCVTYTGSGYVGSLGQNHNIREDWPRTDLTSITRTINYDARSMSEERITKPPQGEQRAMEFVADTFAWNMQGTTITPAPQAAEIRQLDIWRTPHGFLKAALAAKDPKLITRWESGATGGLSSTVQRKVNIISFNVGRFRLNGTLNEQNLLERVQTLIPHPVRGDLNYEVENSNWQDFGGVKFAMGWHQHTDWDDETQPPNYNGGHNTLTFAIKNVNVNACGPALVATEAVQKAAVPPVRAESQKVAEGVYYITGGSHHSVVIEFRDFMLLFEAPQNQARTLAVLAEAKRLVPNKPLRYVVNSHHHFDHLGGIRTAFHEGATVIAHSSNRDFLKQEVLAYGSWTLEPDLLSLHPPTEWAEGYQLETVDLKHAVTDGNRILELYYVQGNPHAEGMLMGYLPRERILIQADMYSPPAPNATPPATPPPQAVALWNNVRAHKLDVATMLPLHGRMVPYKEFLTFVAKTE
jgi:glyoxylase-like metal-dependent hydrolase (beta-lactamase superfamily II)